MRAKSFFHITAGILFLVVAYGIGAHQAGAQSGGQFISVVHAAGANNLYALTSDGDVYWNSGSISPSNNEPWYYLRNVLSGPVNVEAKTLGEVKQLYQGKQSR